MGIDMYIKYEWKTCIKIYWLNHIGKYLYYTRKNSYIKIVNIYYRDNIFFLLMHYLNLTIFIII